MQGKSYLNPNATIPRSAASYLKKYRSEEDQRRLAKRLDTVGWGLFFLWAGIALLTNVSWGVGLLGVGLIVLAIQVARKWLALKWEGVWLVFGAFSVLWGLWLTFHLQPRFLPILCILTGAGLILSEVASHLRERSVGQD